MERANGEDRGNGALEERLTRIEHRLHLLEREVRQLGGAAAAGRSGWDRVPPPGQQTAAEPTSRPPAAPVPPQPPLGRSAWESIPVRSAFFDRDLTVSDLLGARALAWAGGV